MRDHITDSIAAIGPRFDPEILAATRALYAPQVAHMERIDLTRVRLDAPYGPDPRHRLDIFGTDLHGTAVLFVHGGGFTGGDKRPDELFYGNIGHHFAARGMQAALATYRLAPAAGWPAARDDIQRAITWMAENLGTGTRERPLVTIGQSAGACHLASYLWDDETRVHAQSQLAGCVLMSGVYETSGLRSPGAAAYFGTEEELQRRAPGLRISATPIPMLITISEFDPPRVAADGLALARSLTNANLRAPEFQCLRGHNHVSTVHSLGSGQSDVAALLGDFVTRCAAR